MRVTNFVNLFIISLIMGLCGHLSAQQTRKYHSPEHEFLRAEELFGMQQYGSAKTLFGAIYEKIEDPFDTRKQSSLYYMSLCASLLCNEDAPKLAYYFASQYPEYMHLDRVWYTLGNYYFTKKQYKKALAEYAKISTKILSEEEAYAYKFKVGYCDFLQENYDAAKPLFAELQQSDNEYKNKATFYYSHILYTEENYNAALIGFNQLKDEPTYSSIVPFYIAHIYFNTRQYAEIITKKEELLSKSSSKRLPEINSLIAQSYFHLQQYNEAIPYFDTYIQINTQTITPEIYYMAGYCHYQTQQYEQAVPLLTKSISENDSLNQYAQYTLGDCYLKNNQKEFASRAFLAAHEKGNNAAIKEDALYHYAKLQYELSSNPFVGAIASFEKYLNDYPASERKNEAETFLSSIYLTTRNYKAAIASLEKIENKSVVLLQAYQRVTYFRALEFFNDNNLDEAEKYLNISTNNNYDAATYAQALFWKAEIAYLRGNYKESAQMYNLFLNNSKSTLVAEYPLSYYNLGYAEFKQKKYTSAIKYFNNFLGLEPQVGNKKMIADANNRVGDCYFMLSQLETAIAYYDKVIMLNFYDVDYALFQKAQSEGGLSRYTDKNKTMQQLVSQYPNSPYLADAQYEIALNYATAGNTQAALQAFDQFIANNPNNPLVKTALLKKGSIYYNSERDEDAVNTYKQLIKEYPNSEEAGTALKSIENIYVANGNVEDFFNYVRSVSARQITVSYQDSIMYSVASEKYFNGNFVDAEKGFDQYIDRFPEGVFIQKAQYYKGECAMRRNDFAQALPAFKYVIAHESDYQFLLPSLHYASFISYRDSNYTDALNYYQSMGAIAALPSQKTEALEGQMLCQFHLKKYAQAIGLAQNMLQDDKLDINQIETAHLIIARSAMQTDSLALAQKHYQILSRQSKGEAASEALYYLAYIQYLQGDWDTTEKYIFDMLVNITHDYWLAKSYILLGDVYLQKGNSFQAKYTYLSIMENYDGEELKAVAAEKYNAIIAQEENQNKKEADPEENESEE
ncbi:MAG: tetratricopeptide repeat protein [Bacteroidales bacterium]|nr:tetratricopeptide repeat protein [Bacteroidales bacterium]